MAGDDDERPSNDGFPDDLFRQMREGHERFMRDLEKLGQADNIQASSHSSNNPFVAFKHFIDNSLTSFSESFRNLPNNIAALKSKMQEEREARMREEQETLQRWTGVEDASPDHIALQTERLRDEQRDSLVKQAHKLLLRAQEHMDARHISDERIHTLYSDEPFPADMWETFSTPMLSPSGACEFKRENADNGYNMVATSNATSWRWPRRHPNWLSTEWFRRSPYSPLQLEACFGEPGQSKFWRAAFEDLITETLVKDGSSRDFHRVDHAESQSQSGVSWMLGLQQRGVLPPQLPRTFNRTFPLLVGVDRDDMDDLVEALATQRVTGQLGSGPATELDMYEHIRPVPHDPSNNNVGPEIMQAEASGAKAIDEQHERRKQELEALGLDDEISFDLTAAPKLAADAVPCLAVQPEQQAKRVDVLSSLTTTHTTRHPDGSVTTKVVLKERFADGREETQEKVHTYREAPQPSPPVSKHEHVAREQKKAPGWFWT